MNQITGTIFFRDKHLSNQVKKQVVKSENQSAPNYYKVNQMLFLLITGNVKSRNKEINEAFFRFVFFSQEG